MLAVNYPFDTREGSPPSVSLTIDGNLKLSPTSLVRLWVSDPDSNLITGVGLLAITGIARLDGELDIAQLNGVLNGTNLTIVSWGSSSHVFKQVNFLNDTDLALECPACGTLGPFCKSCPLPNSLTTINCTGRYQCALGWCSLDDACGSCGDGVQNIDETDTDCGGPYCDPCLAWEKCLLDRDCVTDVAYGRKLCITVPDNLIYPEYEDDLRCLGCGDQLLNLGESDVDCGSVCNRKCLQGDLCNIDDDCKQFGCNDNTFHCIGCGDLEQSPQTYESDVDCGGDCTLCALGESCFTNLDCGSITVNTEQYQLSCAYFNHTCLYAPECHDGLKNGNETDLDCGGPLCMGCDNNQGCNSDDDCRSIPDGDSECSDGLCRFIFALNNQITIPLNIPPPSFQISPAGIEQLPPADGCHDYLGSGLSVLFSTGQSQCTAYCPYGWTGYPTCQVPLCEPLASNTALIGVENQCYDHGTCLFLEGDTVPECHCSDGWKGVSCSMLACPGSPFACYNRGSCVAGAGESGGVCSCTSQGWGGVDCNTPQCEHECAPHGECMAGADDIPVCFCDTGFHGDDCSLVTCPGTPECSGSSGDCDSSVGVCTCAAGWGGDDCSVPDCSLDPELADCYIHGQCKSASGDIFCQCDPFWDGIDCSTPVCAAGCLASGHGRCSASFDPPRCICEPGWGGSDCSTRLLSCPPGCSGHGDCVSNVCQCFAGWTNSDCGTPDCPGEPDCRSRGSCSTASDPPVCRCLPGFGGVDCAPACPNDCSDHGACEDHNGEVSCACDDQWSGSSCSTALFSCTDNCNLVGECQPDGRCLCDQNFAGLACQHRLCKPTSRASFIQLVIDYDTEELTNPDLVAVDRFLTSQLLDDLVVAVAENAGVSPAEVCLTAVSLTSNASITTVPRAESSVVTIYPTFSLDPVPSDPYACNPGCPEAQDALAALVAALNDPLASGVSPMSEVTGYATVQLAWSDNCPNDCTDLTQGVCRFGVCICSDQWEGPDCSLPGCPGEPDCSNHGECLTNFTEEPLRRCACSVDWKGLACEIGICPMNCSAELDQGSCDISDKKPRCQCNPGFTGDGCQDVVTPGNSVNAPILRWIALGFAAGAIFIVLSSWLVCSFVRPSFCLSSKATPAHRRNSLKSRFPSNRSASTISQSESSFSSP